MKNKYLKGAHLSERKVRELLKLFCEDLTATQIANITGISRITVNAYFKLIRTHIARFCEEKNPLHPTNAGIPILADDNELHPSERSGPHAKKALYGVFKQNDFIYTDKIEKIDPVWLYEWLKGRVETNAEKIEQYRLSLYCGIADFNSVRLHRLNSGLTRGKSQIDEVDQFWGLLKSRLVKFRGLNSGTLYLHVKETEFRYNYREEDLFNLMLDILNHRPLHFSKAERN